MSNCENRALGIGYFTGASALVIGYFTGASALGIGYLKLSAPEPTLAGTRFFKRVEPRLRFSIWNRVESSATRRNHPSLVPFRISLQARNSREGKTYTLVIGTTISHRNSLDNSHDVTANQTDNE